MHELKHSVKALLLADDAVLKEFEERFTLTPLSQSTSGYSRGACKFMRSETTFQIQGNGKSGMVRVSETCDAVTTLEVYVGQSIINVSMEQDLAKVMRAVILADESLRNLFGSNICVTQMSRGDFIPDEEHKQEEDEALTFASFQVKGSNRIGVVGVAASDFHATELVLYTDDEKIRVEPNQRVLKSFCSFPRCTQHLPSL